MTAWLSLALSAVAVAISGYTFLRLELAKRAAVLLVHWESVPDSAGPRDALVVANAGPALARDIEISLTYVDGDPDTRGLELDGHVGTLPAGYEHRFRFRRELYQDPRGALVTWRDRRRGPQSMRVPLSQRPVPAPQTRVEVKVSPELHLPGDLRGRRR